MALLTAKQPNGSKASEMDLTNSGSQAISALIGVLRQAEGSPSSPWLITASVTVVEAHVDRVLKGLVDASGLAESNLGSAILSRYSSEFTRTWSDRFHWLDRGFNVAAPGETEGQDMQTAVELRNAIVHGDMNLTDLQVEKLPSMVQLKRRLWSVLDVECLGRRLILGDRTSAKAATVCVNFVRYFDAKVILSHPSVEF